MSGSSRSTSGRDPRASISASAMASLSLSAAYWLCVIAESATLAVILKVWSAPMIASQGNSRAFSYSAFSSGHSKLPSGRSTREARSEAYTTR
jgi:hypothetical protein